MFEREESGPVFLETHTIAHREIAYPRNCFRKKKGATTSSSREREQTSGERKVSQIEFAIAWATRGREGGERAK